MDRLLRDRPDAQTLKRLAYLAVSPRYITFSVAVVVTLMLLIGSLSHPFLWPLLILGLAVVVLGVHDMTQLRHSILRNYPIAGHIRFIFEEIRPELRQYLFEGETDGVPFNRIQRSLVYRRAKGILDKVPFGTELDVYRPAFEWLNHSIAPREPADEPFRVMVGGPDCTQPYSASVFNISAMSFGALSANAIRALNRGAKLGGFAHDTGEGSFSRYHREGGGDIIWEIGSGYFGCRNPDGSFSREAFQRQAGEAQIRMIEIKLSQGAKPGHGGVLPAAKVSEEIAEARGVPMGVDCVSPASHSSFSTPREMLAFIADLRLLSGGKPIGFKLCIGQPWEFLAICKAMLEDNIYPDFIVVDGTEGGTGAAPQEFVDHIGMPLQEGLLFVHNTLVGLNIRRHIRIGASGKITTAFDIARALAMGADWCNSARGFMFAIGCVQSQKCHTDQCPTGVATQDARRQLALDVPDKAERVFHFHASTTKALAEVVAAAGLEHPSGIEPRHISKRISADQVGTFDQIFRFLTPGEILRGTDDPRFAHLWPLVSPDSFDIPVRATELAQSDLHVPV